MSDVILAIDDDVEFLDYLRLNLKRFGHQVVTATDGLTGVALAADLQPDLITLDIMMPCMDGWEACRRIREVSDAPILMLTAMGRVKDVTRGLDMGADGYLVKPFNTRELLARMKALRRRVALVHA